MTEIGDNPSQPRARDSACTAAGAAATYVLIPLLITAPFVVVYLFVQDVGKAIAYTIAGMIITAGGICALETWPETGFSRVVSYT